MSITCVDRTSLGLFFGDKPLDFELKCICGCNSFASMDKVKELAEKSTAIFVCPDCGNTQTLVDMEGLVKEEFEQSGIMT